LTISGEEDEVVAAAQHAVAITAITKTDGPNLTYTSGNALSIASARSSSERWR
jgi:hypothetical protein